MNKSSPDKAALIEALGNTVVRWQDATQKFDEAVGEIFGLSASERLCLSFLYGGAQTASAIARHIRLTPAAVTTLLDRLEKRGYVRRTADASDRRKVMVEAAEATHKLTREVYLPMAETGAVSLAKYSEEELRIVAAVLADSLAIQEAETVKLLKKHGRT